MGPVKLAMAGTVGLATGALSLTSRSLVVPSEVLLGVEAISPYLATATALQSSNAAIGNALSSGRAVAAVGALTHTPGNAVRAILDGQETTSESLAIQAGSGINVPVAGLLGPASEDEV